MTVRTVDGALPHVKWIDLKHDGVMVECAIIKEDVHGNMYFIELRKLDRIDKARMSRILHDRNVKTFELWDIMSQKILNNGCNCLDYFHQLVKVITPSGKIINPKAGMIGAPLGIIKLDEQERAQLATEQK